MLQSSNGTVQLVTDRDFRGCKLLISKDAGERLSGPGHSTISFGADVVKGAWILSPAGLRQGPEEGQLLSGTERGRTISNPFGVTEAE